MNRYSVYVSLEGSYEVEAESETEAFEIASDYAMSGGWWTYTIDTLEEDMEDEE